MEPVARTDHNFVYVGEHEKDGQVVNRGVGDLSCHKLGHGPVTSHWQPSEAELKTLNEGGHVEVIVHTQPLPPLSIGVAEYREPPIPDALPPEMN